MDTNKNKSIFEFSDPRLISSVLLINKGYSKKLSSVKSLDFSVETLVSKPSDLNKNKQHANVMLSVKTSDEIRMDEDVPVYILVSMEAEFIWKKGAFSDDTLKNLLKVNASSLLLSYIRPHVAEITEASEIPIQHIPFLDFTKNVNDDDN